MGIESRSLKSTGSRASHWDEIYRTRPADEVSWYQREPSISLELIELVGAGTGQAIIDIGGGASNLVDGLVDKGFRDLTVLDISQKALAIARDRINRPDLVHWLHQDVLTWEPDRTYELWHDRAVFHFLVDEEQHRRYLEILSSAIGPEGHVIIGTFASDGPPQCSNLPVRRYAANELMDLLSGFEMIATRSETHVTPAGKVQPFTWIAAKAAAS